MKRLLVLALLAALSCSKPASQAPQPPNPTPGPVVQPTDVPAPPATAVPAATNKACFRGGSPGAFTGRCAETKDCQKVGPSQYFGHSCHD